MYYQVLPKHGSSYSLKDFPAARVVMHDSVHHEHKFNPPEISHQNSFESCLPRTNPCGKFELRIITPILTEFEQDHVK